MKQIIKKEYKNLILVACYIVVAELVYIVLFNSFFKEKVWVTLLVAFGVFLLGCLFGFLYIKDDLKEKKEKEIKETTEAKEVETAKEEKEEALEDTREETKEEIITEENDEKPAK
jgi:arginine exporter protein ArgO